MLLNLPSSKQIFDHPFRQRREFPVSHLQHVPVSSQNMFAVERASAHNIAMIQGLNLRIGSAAVIVSLAACAVADVLLVNPVRDGMNLVAQEGPVLSERGCALVLSREAGAAATLAADALLVNPYDITETADALHQALVMPDAERQRRSAALAAIAAADPPARWLGGQLASLGFGTRA